MTRIIPLTSVAGGRSNSPKNDGSGLLAMISSTASPGSTSTRSVKRISSVSTHPRWKPASAPIVAPMIVEINATPSPINERRPERIEDARELVAPGLVGAEEVVERRGPGGLRRAPRGSGADRRRTPRTPARTRRATAMISNTTRATTATRWRRNRRPTVRQCDRPGEASITTSPVRIASSTSAEEPDVAAPPAPARRRRSNVLVGGSRSFM